MAGQLRAALAIAACTLVGCAAPSEPEAGDDSDEDDQKLNEVDRKQSALSGDLSACSQDNIWRFQFVYPDQFHGNMQVFSAAHPELREWWNLPGCSALVVDWVRGTSTGAGDNSEQAFVTGVADPALLSGPGCQDLWVARKIMTKFFGDSPDAYGRVIVDNQELSGPDCSFSFSAIPWLGKWGYNVGWFSTQSSIRAITQAWLYAFPVAVSAYMQTDNNALEPCPTSCCYSGQQLTCL